LERSIVLLAEVFSQLISSSIRIFSKYRLSNYAYGTGDFTVETWLYFTAAATTGKLATNNPICKVTLAHGNFA
jgi:hypothetical protein